MVLEGRQIAIDRDQTVSAVVAYPEQRAAGPATAVILAHGAGNDMRSTFLSAMHEGLAARGYVAIKFNFPYKEIGRRAPDPAPVLEGCYTRVLDAVRRDSKIAAGRVVIGGKSLGGRMATHLAANGAPIAGVLLLGYPLHAPGKQDKPRVAHLPKIRLPMLFIEGTRDPLCNLDLLRRTLAPLPAPISLYLIEGGDHSFSVPKSMKRPVQTIWDEIVTTAAEWLDQLP